MLFLNNLYLSFQSIAVSDKNNERSIKNEEFVGFFGHDGATNIRCTRTKSLQMSKKKHTILVSRTGKKSISRQLGRKKLMKTSVINRSTQHHLSFACCCVSGHIIKFNGKYLRSLPLSAYRYTYRA